MDREFRGLRIWVWSSALQEMQLALQPAELNSAKKLSRKERVFPLSCPKKKKNKQCQDCFDLGLDMSFMSDL